MDDHLYLILKRTAIILTIAWVGWSFYDSFFTEVIEPGDKIYLAANKLFEDGEYERALKSYQQALYEAPNHIHSLRGKARSLLKLKRYPEALRTYDAAIARQPDFAGTYANRGILYDWIGQHEKALADYETALQKDMELGDGPSWFTRFFRLQPEKPPTIVERAKYLREQLAKPKSEQQLRIPKQDAQQRPYNM
ncbi:tetratricopeptide repeat protein [Candidatus Halobeggiatoa sp. HSG11]|nr:tetratricopeptide repeat protein [Candidatus Halobeggiatoa sp. HSG11]